MKHYLHPLLDLALCLYDAVLYILGLQLFIVNTKYKEQRHCDVFLEPTVKRHLCVFFPSELLEIMLEGSLIKWESRRLLAGVNSTQCRCLVLYRLGSESLMNI